MGFMTDSEVRTCITERHDTVLTHGNNTNKNLHAMNSKTNIHFFSVTSPMWVNKLHCDVFQYDFHIVPVIGSNHMWKNQIKLNTL